MRVSCKIVKVPSIMSSTGESWFALVSDDSSSNKYSSNSYPTASQLEKLLKTKIHELQHQGVVDPLFFTPIGEII